MRFFFESIKKYRFIILLGLIVVSFSATAYLYQYIEASSKNPIDLMPIIIDAGHGGGDPGKVGRLYYESDINLSITLKLERRLAQRGFFVIMTRDNKEGLLVEGEKWDKKTDMKMRREMIDRFTDAVMMISIHQNSHHTASARGAQVFYTDALIDNKDLAELVQKKMREISPVTNIRQPIKNNEFMVLRGNKMPSVMIECGFLSNRSEEELLGTEEYQNKIVGAIYSSICEFFSLTP